MNDAGTITFRGLLIGFHAAYDENDRAPGPRRAGAKHMSTVASPAHAGSTI